jgi:hypothetical protein
MWRTDSLWLETAAVLGILAGATSWKRPSQNETPERTSP